MSKLNLRENELLSQNLPTLIYNKKSHIITLERDFINENQANAKVDLEGRNYRPVIGNAVLLYMHNGTALYILCNKPCILLLSFR